MYTANQSEMERVFKKLSIRMYSFTLKQRIKNVEYCLGNFAKYHPIKNGSSMGYVPNMLLFMGYKEGDTEQNIKVSAITMSKKRDNRDD